MRILLVNPNSSAATTEAMAAVVRGVAPRGAEVFGLTAPSGPMMITEEPDLERAAAVVEGMTPAIIEKRPDAVILAGFGDPGASALRRRLSIPVTGIGEAGLAEAAGYGPFAVVTTTPGLVASITRMVADYGHDGSFRGVFLTEGDPVRLTADPPALAAALEAACIRARDEAHVSAVVIGGGPLARAARALSTKLAFPVVEPLPAALRAAMTAVRAGRGD
jgi:allantoin racemase